MNLYFFSEKKFPPPFPYRPIGPDERILYSISFSTKKMTGMTISKEPYPTDQKFAEDDDYPIDVPCPNKDDYSEYKPELREIVWEIDTKYWLIKTHRKKVVPRVPDGHGVWEIADDDDPNGIYIKRKRDLDESDPNGLAGKLVANYEKIGRG